MQYRVVQDIPGRLRLRCGRDLFDSDTAAGVTEKLLAIPGVQTAKVSPANGSVLVEYEPGARRQALDVIRGLDVLALPQAKGALAEVGGDASAALELAREDAAFTRTLMTMVANRLFKRLLLPPQVRTALCILQSLRFIGEGLKSLARGRLTVEVLDATAIITAMLQRDFSSASSIMFLLNVSDVMQAHVNARTRIALEGSLLVRADTIWVVGDDGIEREIALPDVQPGQLVRVRMGQAVPVDGTVMSGEGEVNEASMTGESALVHKHAGSTVFAGTAVEEGSLVVRVDALPGRSRIDRIVRLVEESTELKAERQSRAEHLADALVPFSFAAFFITLALTRNLARAASVIMVDYSCAIKLTTPIAVMSAMRESLARGAVVKGGKYLEALANADVIVFDKTGTLTTGTPQVERILLFGQSNEREALKLAACLEEHYPHSIARAIVQAAVDEGVLHEDENHAEVEYIVAHGIASSVDGKKVLLGSGHFVFDDEGVPRPEGMRDRLEREAPTASTVFLAVGNQLEAVICLTDPLRGEAADVLAELRALGLDRQVMLTGDSAICAQAIARKLGLDEHFAQVLPEDKSTYVERLRKAGHTVVMVGDGINDSPALAAADVSIALNDATDIARAVADVSVRNADLASLVTLRRLALALDARINRDYRFIVAFNTALIVLGLASIIAPTTGAYLHNISTVGVTAANTRPLLPAPAVNAEPA